MRALFASLASAGCILGLAGASFFTPACNLQQLLGEDAGTSDAAAASDGATTTATGPQGANCVDFATGADLCQYISTCPSTTLNTNLFPHCGYHVHGNDLNLECWCGDALCPVGIATTCDQIPGLVGDQTEDTVCAKEDTGGCVSLTDAGGGAASSGGNQSCNPACTDGCGNTPECYQACGC